MMISLGARWKRAGRAQNVAPMLKQFRLAVGRSMCWQFTSNRRHRSHLFVFQSPMIPVIEESLRHRVLQSLVNIAHFGKIAVCGCSKQTTTCGELPKVINTDHHQKPACAGCIRLSLRPRPHAVVKHSKSRRPQLPRVGAVSFESVAQFEISAFCFL
jgi:hypothetical protein